MLCRVSCEACHLSCLWTDDPRAFLESVCLRYRRCQAMLVYEEFSPRLTRPKAKVRAVARRTVPGHKPEAPLLRPRRGSSIA
jgi:hypothetical protein